METQMYKEFLMGTKMYKESLMGTRMCGKALMGTLMYKESLMGTQMCGQSLMGLFKCYIFIYKYLSFFRPANIGKIYNVALGLKSLESPSVESSHWLQRS